jgi:hypothetical protein
MAITALAPAISRSKQRVIERSSEVALRLVPKIDIDKRADQKVFMLFLTGIGALGLVSLLFVNTLLAQDAFKLSKLQLEARLLTDQREAYIRQLDRISSPMALAAAATEMGMKPSTTPAFLNLDEPQVPATEAVAGGSIG